MDYYDKNAQEFFDKTVNADMSQHYAKFLNAIPKNSHILDAGCGSGRDTLMFLKKGYKVTSIDASIEMCKIASQYTKQKIIHKRFQEIEFVNQFDGIWASASLLHVPSKEIELVLCKLRKSLKNEGVLYSSFKYGNYEGIRNGRYFNDLTEETAQHLFEMSDYTILDTWITEDVRKDRHEEKWVNILVRK